MSSSFLYPRPGPKGFSFCTGRRRRKNYALSFDEFFLLRWVIEIVAFLRGKTLIWDHLTLKLRKQEKILDKKKLAKYERILNQQSLREIFSEAGNWSIHFFLNQAQIGDVKGKSVVPFHGITSPYSYFE